MHLPGLVLVALLGTATTTSAVAVLEHGPKPTPRQLAGPAFVRPATPPARVRPPGAAAVLTPRGSAPPAAVEPAAPSTGAPPAPSPPRWAAPSPPRWGWPLSPRPQVVRRFDPPAHPWSAGHRGVDLLATVGEPVRAAGAGVVVFSGVIAGRGVVSIAHGGGWRTTYEPLDHRVQTGTVVSRGDVIGTVAAATGHCAPRTCVHWGALVGGGYRDPLALLGLVRPVLLPVG